jgi:hypothetical protein
MGCSLNSSPPARTFTACPELPAPEQTRLCGICGPLVLTLGRGEGALYCHKGARQLSDGCAVRSPRLQAQYW